MWFLPVIAGAVGMIFHALAEQERADAARQRQWMLEEYERRQRERARQEALAKLSNQFLATATHARRIEHAADAAAEQCQAVAALRTDVERALQFHTWWRPLCVPISKILEERRTRRTLLATLDSCTTEGAAANRDWKRYEAERARWMRELKRMRAEASALGGQLSLPGRK